MPRTLVFRSFVQNILTRTFHSLSLTYYDSPPCISITRPSVLPPNDVFSSATLTIVTLTLHYVLRSHDF